MRVSSVGLSVFKKNNFPKFTSKDIGKLFDSGEVPYNKNDFTLRYIPRNKNDIQGNKSIFDKIKKWWDNL